MHKKKKKTQSTAMRMPRRAGSLEGAAPSNNPGQALRQLSSASMLEPVEAPQRGGVQQPPPFA